jgi:hypothetical protein
MRSTIRIPTILSAALASGGLATAIAFWVTTSPLAQTPVPAAGSIAVTEVPFYAEWASSPHAHKESVPFTYWNKEGTIPVACAGCHSTPGFLDLLGADGSAAGKVDRPAPTGTVIGCIACHNSATRALTSVTFPSGVEVDNQGADARCMACHQGRTSFNSVGRAISGQDDDVVNSDLSFINIHYRAAAATLFGSTAHGGYEYPGKAYAGRFQHVEAYNRCTACHDPHATTVRATDCRSCHTQVTDTKSLRQIRMSKTDFDGNGRSDEGIAQEIENLRTQLHAAIVAYAKDVSKKAVVYSEHVNPYFFIDTNGNGIADEDEARMPNKYNAWSPRLLKAAYNYQFVSKDPGAYAHNPAYALQLLYDSLSDLGARVPVNLSRANRP